MNITIDYRNASPSHCGVAIFIGGALTGVLTLAQGDLVAFQDILIKGMIPTDKFLATGDPGPWMGKRPETEPTH